MTSLTANELQRGDVSALKQAIEDTNEQQIAINVRRKAHVQYEL